MKKTIGLLALSALSTSAFAAGDAQKPQTAGQVVFSGKPITRDGGELVTEVQLGDPLFMAYTSKDTVAKLLPDCGDKIEITSRYSLNGADDGQRPEAMPAIGGENLSKVAPGEPLFGSLSEKPDASFTRATAWSLDADQLSAAPDGNVRGFNVLVVPMLKEGDNTLHIVMTAGCRRGEVPVAEGTLTIKVPAGAKQAYLAKYGPKLGKSPSKEDKKLAPEIKKALAADPEWAEEEVMGSVVRDKAWEPIRHEITGKVIAKDIHAYVVVRKKGAEDPEQCRLFSLTFRRDAAGGALFREGTGGSTTFPCASAPR